MKPIRILVATLGLAATAAMAQPHGGGFGGPGPRFDIDDLAVLLDLDAYQKQEVQRVFTERRAAAEAAREARPDDAARPSRDEMRAAREQAREATFTQLQAVLTEQQIVKLKLLTEGPEGRGGRRGPPGDAGKRDAG